MLNEWGGFEGLRGNPGYPSDFNALVSMAGAVFDINWIDEGESPIIAIHSTDDPEVPFGCEGIECGTLAITERATEVGIDNFLSSIISMNHDAPTECPFCYESVLRFLLHHLK